jgi:hypothetical protein
LARGCEVVAGVAASTGEVGLAAGAAVGAGEAAAVEGDVPLLALQAES